VRVTSSCDSINSFVICQTDSVEANPAIDFDGTNYVVLWDDNRFGEYRVVAARVTPQCAVLDTGNCIGETGVDEMYPDVVFNGTDYFAVWCHYSAPYGVTGRFVNTQALPVGTVINIANTLTYKYVWPKVAFSGNNYLVVWPDMLPVTFDANIYGQLISLQGELVGSRITIADDPSAEIEPYVAFDNTKYLVAWNDSGVIWGRYIDTLGQLTGPSFLISENTGRTHFSPWIAVSDTNYLVVWSKADIDRDIYGNLDLVIGLNENINNRSLSSDLPCAAIFAGPLVLPADKKCKLFDIIGRTVVPDKIKPGIYFIEIDGQITRKIIKIR
jgi:hypothetical protein